MNDIVRKPAARAAKVKPPFAALPAVEAPGIELAALPIPTVLPVPASATVPPALVSTPPAAPSAPAAPAPALEGPTMATTVDAAFQPTDKVQSLISDAQTRAREAMEKGTKAYEEMGSFAKGNVEAMMASSRLATSGLEALGQDVADYGKRSFEQATAAFKSFATVKSPTELFQLQSDFARQAFDGMVAEGSKFSEKMLKLAGDVAQPLSNRLAVAAEKVKVGL